MIDDKIAMAFVGVPMAVGLVLREPLSANSAKGEIDFSDSLIVVANESGRPEQKAVTPVFRIRTTARSENLGENRYFPRSLGIEFMLISS